MKIKFVLNINLHEFSLAKSSAANAANKLKKYNCSKLTNNANSYLLFQQ